MLPEGRKVLFSFAYYTLVDCGDTPVYSAIVSLFHPNEQGMPVTRTPSVVIELFKTIFLTVDKD